MQDMPDHGGTEEPHRDAFRQQPLPRPAEIDWIEHQRARRVSRNRTSSGSPSR
jgi:hypothetical protein